MTTTLRLACLLLLISISVRPDAQTPLQFRDTSIKGSQTFAIIVGVSKYKYIRPLSYADKDAILFSDYLKSPGGGNVKDDNIFMLLNEEASNSNFWTKGFQWLKAKQLQKGDKLFIYLAGHGDAIDQDQFFFLGFDCNPEGDKNNYLVSGTIQLFNLKKKIAREANKGVEVFFIMDACRSNELPGGLNGQSFLNTAISEKEAGEIIMLATGAGQESLEDKSIGNGHGLFTYYLVDGLSGVADSEESPDYKITFNEIQTYVDKNVPSVAEERFKRKQEPYFCCNENSEKVISTVDPVYLQKWLQIKKTQNRGGGNTFEGFRDPKLPHLSVDTLLLETYNQFYKAINKNIISGNSSAEEYFQQLTSKYPGNPYTLDAKSTLTVKYIDYAQLKVDQYLSCIDGISQKEKQENVTAAVGLEKAIDYVREDDEDFANSLRGRLYLLKASGNNDISNLFQNAYAALSIDPNGAYIHNKLALLHLENNNMDSAVFYADKATKIAPNWACAFLTLAKVQKSSGQNNSVVKKKANELKKKAGMKMNLPKSSFGFTIGAGLTQLNVNADTNSIRSPFSRVESKSTSVINLGIIFYTFLSKNIAIRPSATVQFGKSDILFHLRTNPGEPEVIEPVPVNYSSVSGSLPFVFPFNGKNVTPYLTAGASFSLSLSNTNSTDSDLPLKKTSFTGDAGIGIDIPLKGTKFVLSPELKYAASISDSRDNSGSGFYSSFVNSFKKNFVSFNLYLRRK